MFNSRSRSRRPSSRPCRELALRGTVLPAALPAPRGWGVSGQGGPSGAAAPAPCSRGSVFDSSYASTVESLCQFPLFEKPPGSWAQSAPAAWPHLPHCSPAGRWPGSSGASPTATGGGLLLATWGAALCIFRQHPTTLFSKGGPSAGLEAAPAPIGAGDDRRAPVCMPPPSTFTAKTFGGHALEFVT